MKKIGLIILALSTISAHAAPALSTYYCKHRKDPRFESRARYDFRIVENKELSREGHDSRRSVTVERILVVGSESAGRVIKSFEAIATYDDVEYAINAEKDHDFLFSLYLDEEGPGIVVSHDSFGTEIKSKYDCTLETR